MKEYHVIKMVRNANIRNLSDGNFDETGIPEGCHTFLMLDYFDFLFHIELKEDRRDYETFLGMNESLWGENSKPAISQRIIGLYTEDKIKENIFGQEEISDDLSEQPLLGLIQIGITPQYMNYLKQKYRFAKDCLNAAQKEITNILQQEKFRFAIFHVLTSGDIYAAVRGASLQEIYKAAITIGHLRQENTCGKQEKLWKFTTYTNVGIECSFRNGCARTFSSLYIEEHKDDEFVLRFSAAPEIHSVLQSVLQQYNIKGLFGRYDYSVTLSMKIFADLYPSLCLYKGPGNPPEPQAFDLSKAQSVAQVSFPALIRYGLDTHQIKILNERAIVAPPDEKLEKGACSDPDLSEYGEVDKKNRDIECKYHALDHMRDIFIKNRNSFKDSYRALGELIHAYGPLGYETDSKLNWKQYCILMDVLFENIEYYKELIHYQAEQESETPDIKGQFLANFRDAVEAVGHYIKFIQSMNQQTFQSPVYEIQTRVDAEKLFMAYTEFMKEYLDGYYQYDWSKKNEKLNKEERMKFCPIIYPNLIYRDVSVISPFNTGRESDEYPKISDGDGRTLFLFCRIPSFEYFGRFYEMIPLLLHEMSHHILVLPRKQRNDFIIYYMIKGAVCQLFHLWVMQHSRDKVLDNYGQLEKKLIDIFSRYYADVFKQTLKRDLDKCKIHYLEKKLYDFLEHLGNSFGEANWEQTAKIPQNYRPVLTKYLLEYLFRFEGDVSAEINRVKDIAAGTKQMLPETQELIFWIRQELTKTFQKNLEARKIFMVSEAALTQEQKNAKERLWNDLQQFQISEDDLVLQRLFLEQKIENLCRSILNQYGLFHKFLDEFIMPEVKSYCFDMLKLSDLLHLAYMLERHSQPVENEEHIEIQEDYWNQINAVIELCKDKAYGMTYFCDLDVIQYANELGVDFKDKRRVFDNWEKHGKQVDGSRMKGWAEKNFTLYRETCADIIMSRAINFTAFGFLNFAVNILVNMYEADVLVGSDPINIKRFKLVIAVLLPKEKLKKLDCGDYDVDCQELKEQCSSYILANIKWAGNIILEALKEFGQNRMKRETLEGCLELVKNYTNVLAEKTRELMASCETEQEARYIRDLLSNSLEDLNNELFKRLGKENHDEKFVQALYQSKQRIDRQGEFWLIIYMIFIKENYLVEGLTEEHLREIYEGIKNHNGLCLWQKENHDSVKMIAEYYNKPDGCCLQNKKIMLDNTVHFIEDYYYKNRVNLTN